MRTLARANEAVIAHQSRPGGGETRMGTREVLYSEGGNVILILWPGSQMTWGMFRSTLR